MSIFVFLSGVTIQTLVSNNNSTDEGVISSLLSTALHVLHGDLQHEYHRACGHWWGEEVEGGEQCPRTLSPPLTMVKKDIRGWLKLLPAALGAGVLPAPGGKKKKKKHLKRKRNRNLI